MVRKGKADVLIDIKGDQKGLDRAVSKSNRLLAKLGNSASNAASKMAKIGLAAAGIAAAFSVVSVKQALAFDGLDRGLKRLVSQQGGDADKFMAKMKEMSRNTVSEMDIMKKANMGLMLGLTPEILITFMEAATAIAQNTGQSVDYMFESLVTGTARQSKLWLDNLSIMIDVEKAYKTHADVLGIHVDELTDQQRATAFTNATLMESKKKIIELGGVIKDTNMKWGEMKAFVSDLTVTFGQKLMPEFDKVLDWFLINKDWLITTSKEIFKFDVENFGETVTNELDEIKKWTETNKDTLSDMWSGFITATDAAITGAKILLTSIATIIAAQRYVLAGFKKEDLETLREVSAKTLDVHIAAGEKPWMQNLVASIEERGALREGSTRGTPQATMFQPGPSFRGDVSRALTILKLDSDATNALLTGKAVSVTSQAATTGT